MIEAIKEKLGTNLVYIEQEKFDNEYVDSYALTYKDEIVELYFNEYWFYTIGGCRSKGSTKLESALNELIQELT